MNSQAMFFWQMVRARRCCGEKFRREHVIEPYTVDFCCISLKLIIEVDGEHHFTDEGIAHDQVRDRFLEELGYRVVRIPGYTVLNDAQSVRKQIVDAIAEARGS